MNNNFFQKFKSFVSGPGHDPRVVPLPIERGYGYTFNGNEFVHHTKLHYSETAFFNLVRHQKIVLFALLSLFVLALVLNWHLSLVIFLSTSTIIYFLGFLFDAYVVYRTFRYRPEVKVLREEMDVVSENTWPSYTIFCPLYKEWQVVPQFVTAMQELDYPKEKLQIMFLLEENDPETISKIRDAQLPKHYEIVVVPHSKPKTKPKAMNYGLQYATGDYLVIYDAEDVPDPDQLKKAVLAFGKVSENTVCIQAKLNFYNPKQNILTRVFTAEYSLWFDLVLPGLQSISAPIPLGGTSNHFKTHVLRELAGWDAFNVTEDCDLGMRLAKRGYRTAVVDSTTHEEANSDLQNWYNQRSRWIKGYIQTYLVHMRNPFASYQGKGGLRDLILFQFIVGSKTLSLFINPVMWMLTIIYFGFRAKVGVFIESLFPGPILYIGVFSLVFGNFFYLYYYMVGCAKRGYDDIIKYVFLVPFYWLAMSAAAWQALYEIFVKPHYWAKTVHGLHLAGGATKIDWAKHEDRNVEPKRGRFSILVDFFRSGGGMLVTSLFISNILNVAFVIYLERELSLDEFGIVMLVSTFSYVLTLFVGALSTTVTRTIAFLEGVRAGGGSAFYAVYLYRLLAPSFFLTYIWILSVPFISMFLNISQGLIVLLFAPAIFIGIFGSFNEGYLKGTWNFGILAGAGLFEVFTKLVVAMCFLSYGFRDIVSLSIPLSVIGSWIATSLGVYWVQRRTSRLTLPVKKSEGFPVVLYSASLINGLAVTVFLGMDVLLARHYLSSDDAGLYIMLSLVGKLVFFFGSVFNTFIVTQVGRAQGENKDPKKVFRSIFLITFILTTVVSVLLILVGPVTVPYFLGPQSVAILPYLQQYLLALAFFTISTTIALYRLARKEYFFAVLSLLHSVALVRGLGVLHASISDFVHVMFWTNAGFLLLFVLFHLYYDILEYSYRNARDLLAVVRRIPPGTDPKPGKMRILMFNWRDTKSVFAGGAEVYVQSLASRWAKEGHAVTLFTSNDGQLPGNGETDGVRIIRRGGFYATYVLAFFYYMVHFRGKFEVIIDSENGIPFFTPLYAKERVYCLVHHVHQEVFRKALIWPVAQFACFLEKRMMPMVYKNSVFITVSDSSREELYALGVTQNKIEIVHPGVDLDFLIPGTKAEYPLVSYVGRMQEHKSIHVLVQAFPFILEQFPTARLAIAGDGDEKGLLMALVNKLGISESCTFYGKVGQEKKREIMQASWVTVNPSMMEGWGITTIEANACGTPMVASDVPGLRDSVRDGVTGILVPFGHVNEFADTIIRILKDQVLRESLSAGALSWARNFGWDKSCQKFFEIISGHRDFPLANKRT